MIDKDINEIEIKDIANLVEQQQPEGKRFEFKKEYNPNKDTDASKLLEEVVSFSNDRGGDLILGIEEVDGVAGCLSGMDLGGANIDKVRNQWASLIRGNVEPEIPSNLVDIKPLQHGNGRWVLLFRVRSSWRKPHRVTKKGVNKFVGRSAGGKEPMSVAEIRRLAVESERSKDEIAEIHSERIEKLRENNDFPELADDPKIVLHIIPHETVQSGEQVGLESAVRNRDVRLPLLAARVIRNPNLSGDLGRVTLHSPHDLPAWNVVQVFRTGFIEAVSTMGFVVEDLVIEGDMEEAPYLNASVLRESLERTVGEYLSQLSAYDAHGPYHVFLTLLDAKGYYVVKRPMQGAKIGIRPLGDNVVKLPEIRATGSHDTEDTIDKLMDQIFQAVGAQAEPRVRSTE